MKIRSLELERHIFDRETDGVKIINALIAIFRDIEKSLSLRWEKYEDGRLMYSCGRIMFSFKHSPNAHFRASIEDLLKEVRIRVFCLKDSRHGNILGMAGSIVGMISDYQEDNKQKLLPHIEDYLRYLSLLINTEDSLFYNVMKHSFITNIDSLSKRDRKVFFFE